MAYIRTVRTASGARAVQIVYSTRGGAREMEHIGSAHDDVELDLLKTVARQKLAGGQGELDLGLQPPPEAGGPLRITGSRMGHLWEALSCGYDALGFDRAAGGDEVFRQLVLARIIEPTSKLDSLRVLAEAGIDAVSYPTMNRRLRVYSTEQWREQLAAACARQVNLGPESLVLFDVTTLCFETDAGDCFREPGFCKERPLGAADHRRAVDRRRRVFPHGERVRGQQSRDGHDDPDDQDVAHGLADVVVVADAGMVSEANKRAIEAERLSFILGARIPDVPYVVDQWRKHHPSQDIPDGHVFTQPWPAGPSDRRRDQVIYYQYKHDRARRTLRSIDTQVAKAERAVAGQAPVKRNRFITLSGGTRTVNRSLEAKARALAGLKAYITNIADPSPEFVIGAYHRLFQIEKSFRMAKTDLAARPIYARTRDSIEAHLTIAFAALAVSRWVEETTGWTIKKLVKTIRRYRSIDIELGEHTVTAADPYPPTSTPSSRPSRPEPLHTNLIKLGKCLYLVTRSLDPTGRGRARWSMRWKPALNAFAITFPGRIVPSTAN